MSILSKAILVCPTCNPGGIFQEWLMAYSHQQYKPSNVLIIDSSSTDGSMGDVSRAGFRLETIPKQKFNHGATRQWAVSSNPEYEYIIFLTQDAILYGDDALRKLLSAFDDPDVGGVYGRQLPRAQAGPIEAFSRLYNYPDVTDIRSYEDRDRLGVKAAYFSNSFAAYRKEALLSVGGFPSNVIFGEDMFVAAKMLQSGWKIAYQADACVYHSHDYSIVQDFRRYFDMGVFHAGEPWIKNDFGSAENEGFRFVISEIVYLLHNAFWRIPEAILRIILGFIGYRLGKVSGAIPVFIKRRLSMNAGYF